MDFLKKHYEKIILSVVLLVVAAAAFWLTQTVSEVQASLEEQLQTKVRGNKKQLQPVDLTNAITAVQLISKPVALDLSGDHNVFNPVRWIRGADGVPKPDPRLELSTTLKLTQTRPLFLSITYLGPTGIGDPYRYQFSIEQQAAKKVSDRRPVTLSLTEGTKNNFFRLQEVRGPKDTSGEVVIELVGGERATLTKSKPFQKAMGYMADLRFENRDFIGKRADDNLVLAGTTYKIVAIGKDELVVSAPNGTRTTIKLSSN
jgi:hypothetical protein